jgi:hypothetical protein
MTSCVVGKSNFCRSNKEVLIIHVLFFLILIDELLAPASISDLCCVIWSCH